MNIVSYDEAVSIMDIERKETEDIGIFTDNGWGDDPDCIRTYHIVKDGNGQKPIADITKETFDSLISNSLIGSNILQTFKDRTFHNFKEKNE